MGEQGTWLSERRDVAPRLQGVIRRLMGYEERTPGPSERSELPGARDDVDAVVAKALQRGATQEGETKDEFHGDRSAKIVDPFGHRWFVSTRIEEVSYEEVERRFAKMMGGLTGRPTAAPLAPNATVLSYLRSARAGIP